MMERITIDAVCALFDADIDVTNLLAAYGIRLQTCELCGSIHAFVWYSGKGRYYIIANNSLSPEAMRQAFFHELKHILQDMPQTSYYVGLDQHRHPIEKEADMFLETAAAYAVK